MDYRFLITLFIISVSSTNLYAEKESTYGQYLQKREQQKPDSANENSPMQMIMEIPEVQAFKKACEQDSKLAECIWKKVKANGPLKNRVDQILNGGVADSENKGAAGKYGLKGAPAKRYQHKGFDNLRNYFAKKLNKVLYGVEEGDTKIKKDVDHTIFYDLQKSQVANSIVMAVSSFCVDAMIDDSDRVKVGSGNKILFLIPKKDDDQKKVTKKNLEEISKDENSIKQMGELYNACIANVTHSCYKSGDHAKDSITFDGKDIPIDTMKTKTRACEVVQYLKSSRVSLTSLDTIKEDFDKLDEKGKGLGFENQREVYGGKKNKDIVNLASSEFRNDSGFQKGIDDEKKEFQKCAEIDEQGSVAAISDAKECERYLANSEDLDEIATEAELRAFAQKDRVKETIKTDEGLHEFLESEGYTKEQIQEKFLDPDKLTEEITKRYDAEKDALIESLRSKTKKNKISGDQIGTGDREKLNDIQTELSSERERYSNLIQFNNVVSAFLKVEDSKGEMSGNIQGLKRELEYRPENKEDRNPASGSIEGLKAAVEASGIMKNASKSEESGVEIDVDTINSAILKYESDESGQEKK